MSMKINLDLTKIFKLDQINDTQSRATYRQKESELYELRQKEQNILQINQHIFPVTPTVTSISNRHFNSYYTSKRHVQCPGQRLYYQSQIDHERKIQQIKIQQEEIITKEKTESTFKPLINSVSKKILERKKNKKPNNLKKIKQKQIPKSTQLIKAQLQMKQCTFHPTLINKDKKLIRNKQKVFQQLYNKFEIKQLREKIKNKIQPEIQKVITNQKQINNFLERNEKYQQKINKKQKIMQMVSKQYDLNTGQKLYQPLILNSKASSNKYNCSQIEIQHSNRNCNFGKSGIFNKNDTIQEDKYQTNTTPKKQINKEIIPTLTLQNLSGDTTINPLQLVEKEQDFKIDNDELNSITYHKQDKISKFYEDSAQENIADQDEGIADEETFHKDIIYQEFVDKNANEDISPNIITTIIKSQLEIHE